MTGQMNRATNAFLLTTEYKKILVNDKLPYFG